MTTRHVASDLQCVQLNSVLFSSTYPSKLAVINKVHCCVALRRDGHRDKQTPLLSAINNTTAKTVKDARHSSRYRSESHAFVGRLP